MCPILCQCLCNELNYVLMCLTRIKAELSVSQRKITPVCQDQLKAREKAICHRIVLVILATTSFTKAIIPLGQCTESVFNLLYQVYRAINVVTKHFLVRSTYHEPVYKHALLSIHIYIYIYLDFVVIFRIVVSDLGNCPRSLMTNCCQTFPSLSCLLK